MSFQSVVTRCEEASDHFSQLPDIREHVLDTTMVSEWVPEDELKHELDALCSEIQSLDSDIAKILYHLEK